MHRPILLAMIHPRARDTDEPPWRDMFDHLMLDPDAASAEPETPAFMAPPEGAPPFHGFAVLDDVESGGLTWGGITDFEHRPGLATGDAFVVAPDGSRAGIEWRAGDTAYVLQMAPPSAERWGVYLIGVTRPMVDRATVAANLADVAPDLRAFWEEWATESD